MSGFSLDDNPLLVEGLPTSDIWSFAPHALRLTSLKHIRLPHITASLLPSITVFENQELLFIKLMGKRIFLSHLLSKKM
jgi:hypothetical protein